MPLLLQLPLVTATAADTARYGTVTATATITARCGTVTATAAVTARYGTVTATATVTARYGTVTAAAAVTARYGTVTAAATVTARYGTVTATATVTSRYLCHFRYCYRNRCCHRYATQGRDKEAKELLQRALETVEKFFGPEHPVAVQLRAILGPGGWGGDEGL